ncbi:MAG: glycosyltransferase family 4 protein [candidate division SR1 bacterium]|nr:glycosyltransferase family 4 protein [candidate division SR1 bacterium]
MNILWVASPLTDTRGGALTVTKNMVQGLKNNTHIYIGSCKYMGEIFTANGGKFIKSFPGFEPVNIKNWLLMPVSFILGFIQVVKYRKLYQAADRVIVITCHTEVFFTIPWVLFLFKKPVTIMNHTGRCPQSLYKNPLRFIMKWVYNRSQVVFVSNAHLNMWKKYDLAGKNPVVVYNGIKIDSLEQIDKLKTSEITFGYLGRIEEQKGMDILFRALESLYLSQKITIKFGGVGVDFNKYKAWSDKIVLKNPNISIIWLGQVQDTKAFFNSINCLIFPSKFESFGLVMVEAWERGVPVICSNIPAFIELKSFTNKEDEKRLIFESENSNSLSEKIMYFINNTAFYQTLEYQKKLHTVVQENFSLDQAISNIKNILS